MSKLYISAGHGGKDPGAVKRNRLEKNYTLQIAGAVSELLRAAGHEAMRDRTTDVQTLINDKIKAANNAKVDAVFDIHLNAGGGTGCEVYYTRHGGIGKTLAENICAEIAKLGYSNRGAKVKKNALGQDYFGIIRDTKAPANLVECCFIDSDTDMTRLNVQSMAQAIVNGILSVYPAVQKPAPVTPQKPAQPAPVPSPAPLQPKTFKIGDVVQFTGGSHYKTSTSALPTGGKRTAGSARITNINLKGKHPYSLIGVSSNVYGWVDKALIK